MITFKNVIIYLFILVKPLHQLVLRLRWCRLIDRVTVWVCRSSGGGEWSQRQKGGAREPRLSLTAAAAGNTAGDQIKRDHDHQRFEPRLTSILSPQNRQSLLEEKEERNAELERLQEALERSEQEQVTLRHKLTDMEKELQTSLDQWARSLACFIRHRWFQSCFTVLNRKIMIQTNSHSAVKTLYRRQ